MGKWRNVLRLSAATAALLFAILAAAPGYAQGPKAEPDAKAAPAAASAAPAVPALPPPEVLLSLIRNSILAINHANITNNYTVLYQLGSPLFLNSTSPEKLQQAFANLRARAVDLSLTLAATPQVTEPPIIDNNGLLRIKGAFPTNPELAFDFVFQFAAGIWRHAGLNVNLKPPAPPAPPVAAKDAKKTSDNKATEPKKAPEKKQ